MNWTELLFYIKTRMGANRANPLELSDVEIIDIIKMIVLPELSIYLPDRIYVELGSDTLIHAGDKPGLEGFEFVYNLPNDRKIIAVNDLYFNETLANYDETYESRAGVMADPESMGALYDRIELKHYATSTFFAPFTWEILPPSRLLMRVPEDQRRDFQAYPFIAKLLVEHINYEMVPRDQVVLARDLALSEIMMTIGKIRSKFTGLNSQFGVIDLNGDRLEQEGQQLRRETIEKFENNPPEQVLYFLN